MEDRLKIAVFIDFDNIEIGVKSTLQRDFDVAAVLDALKERGEIVTKIAYANWGRQETSTRQLAEHAVQMVQRDPSPRGDKNGADINLALDALEMAFTHDHINAYAIVSGDSDFIALVNKLKTYDKRVYVVGGKAFTSTILQKNCHEFVSYESLLVETQKPARHQGSGQPQQPQQQPHQQPPRHPHRKPAPLDLSQSAPLVERALQVLERREVQPQLGLLKSTMLQLDSTFNEKAYGAGSFTDFVEKLEKAGYVRVVGSEGRYMIERKAAAPEPEKPSAKPEEALPLLRDVLETHRLEVDEGCPPEQLAEWVQSESPGFDWRTYGFQEFSELLNYAQDKSLVRMIPDQEKHLTIYLGAEFHPPALQERPAVAAPAEPPEERQPAVAGQPEARAPKPRKAMRKKTAQTKTQVKAAAKTKARAAATKRPRKRAAGPPESAPPVEFDDVPF
jgi:uncharacterized protein (TIGR00288 family)